jgi:hypothetical protein
VLVQALDEQLKSSIRGYPIHIKNLDILSQSCYQMLTFTQLSLPINFQHNFSVPALDMKTHRQKVLKVKRPGIFCTL